MRSTVEIWHRLNKKSVVLNGLFNFNSGNELKALFPCDTHQYRNACVLFFSLSLVSFRFKSNSKVQKATKKLSVHTTKSLCLSVINDSWYAANIMLKPLGFCSAYARAITCHVNCSRLRYVCIVRQAQCEAQLLTWPDSNHFSFRLGIKVQHNSRLTGHFVLEFVLLEFVRRMRNGFYRYQRCVSWSARASSNNHKSLSSFISLSVTVTITMNKESVGIYASVRLFFSPSFRLDFYVIMILWMFGISHKCNKKQFAL